MTRFANSVPHRVWIAKLLMSLGVLYAAGMTWDPFRVAFQEAFWAHSAITTALLVGGLVIGLWGERPEPGFKKRAATLAIATLLTIAAVWAVWQGYI